MVAVEPKPQNRVSHFLGSKKILANPQSVNLKVVQSKDSFPNSHVKFRNPK